jgi:hypothetical protein
MTMAQVGDALQVLQGLGILILVIKSLGSWQQRQESAPAELARDLRTCKEHCAARLTTLEHEQEDIRSQLDRDFPRKETLAAELKGINVRLANIERAVMQQPQLAED